MRALNEWLDRDAGRVLGGMNGCAISDLEGLSGAKSFETPRTPIVEKQGVDKGLKSVILALRRYQRGAKRSLRHGVLVQSSAPDEAYKRDLTLDMSSKR